MGAWIEMLLLFEYVSCFDSRTPRWVRGLKLVEEEKRDTKARVAPHDGCVD